MYRIKDEDINPELVEIGKEMRTKLSGMNEDELKVFFKEFEGQLKASCKPEHSIMEEMYIERPDHSKMKVLLFRPKEKKQNVPAMLWMHGGGYLFGIPEQEMGCLDRFIAESSCIVISPDYRNAFEAPYPSSRADG